MESLLRNAQSYACILKRCQTEEVVNWKEEDLKRALHWTQYFKNVYEKTKLKQSVRKQINARLVSLSNSIGPSQLNFEFLEKGMEYLVKSLLDNPALSNKLMLLLMRDEHSQPFVTKHLQESAESKLLLDSLMACQSTLYQEKELLYEILGLPIIDGPIVVNASQLMGDLKSMGTDIQSMECKLTQVSQSDGGLETIIVCLLWSTKSSDQCFTSHYQSPTNEDLCDKVLQWLIDHCQSSPPGKSELTEQWSGVWSLPPHLLACVSRHHDKFFKLHLEHLVQTAVELDQSVENMDSNQFQKLVQHFKLLTQHSSALKEECAVAVKTKIPLCHVTNKMSVLSQLYSILC